ncbi:hypothetical protein ACQEVG_13425 [Streptomyces sp. CA-135486]
MRARTARPAPELEQDLGALDAPGFTDAELAEIDRLLTRSG